MACLFFISPGLAFQARFSPGISSPPTAVQKICHVSMCARGQPSPQSGSAIPSSTTTAESLEWAAAASIAGSAAVFRATGIVGNQTADDLSVAASGSAATAATVAGLSIAKGVAAKAAVTTATTIIAGPLLKMAIVGASLVQIGVDKYNAQKSLSTLVELEETSASCTEAAMQASAAHARVISEFERAKALSSTAAHTTALMPPVITTRPRPVKMAAFATAGTCIGAFLPRKLPPLAFALATMSICVRLVKLVERAARKKLETKADALTLAAAQAAATAEAAEEASAAVELFRASEADYDGVVVPTRALA